MFFQEDRPIPPGQPGIKALWGRLHGGGSLGVIGHPMQQGFPSLLFYAVRSTCEIGCLQRVGLPYHEGRVPLGARLTFVDISPCRKKWQGWLGGLGLCLVMIRPRGLLPGRRYGANSSTSVIKTPRSIRKFFFHSDSGNLPGFRQILPRRQACLGAFRSRATAISYWLAI